MSLEAWFLGKSFRSGSPFCFEIGPPLGASLLRLLVSRSGSARTVALMSRQMQNKKGGSSGG